MKRFLFALLLACSGSVAAAPSCFPNMAPPTFIDVNGTPKLGEVVYAASSVGVVWGYTCQDSTGKWWKVMAYGNWEQFPKDWLFILDTAIRGTDADRRALWDKYAVATTIDERLIPDWDAVAKLLPNPPPPPVVTEWKVLADPFRADKKRLVYSVVNGKRGASTGQYIAAGEPCDPVTTITEFGPTYFLSVNGNPNTVARCAK
jgi:hypothetical protein